MPRALVVALSHHLGRPGSSGVETWAPSWAFTSVPALGSSPPADSAAWASRWTSSPHSSPASSPSLHRLRRYMPQSPGTNIPFAAASATTPGTPHVR